MILVTIAVLMADTTPLTRTDTVAVDVNGSKLAYKQLICHQNTIVQLLLSAPITADPPPSTCCIAVGVCEHFTCSTTMLFVNSSYDNLRKFISHTCS